MQRLPRFETIPKVYEIGIGDCKRTSISESRGVVKSSCQEIVTFQVHDANSERMALRLGVWYDQ